MNTLAFTYLGVAVYNTYKDDNYWGIMLRNWFSLSADPDSGAQAFDVRELRAWACVADTGAYNHPEMVLRYAIESGELMGLPVLMAA